MAACISVVPAGFAAAPRPLRRDVRANATKEARIAVLGASGYTGAEVVRLLALHPHMRITAMTGDSQAGKDFSEVFPHLIAAPEVPRLIKIDDVKWSEVDAAFCCLPHATTQTVVKSLPSDIKVVDLSADFRLKDVAVYAKWYGGEHLAPELQKEAVYGLTEHKREEVKKARLVANPGCYPTCTQLPLLPLLKNKLIKPTNITIDAKSGTSGAGRSAKQPNLYCEVTEGMHAYGVSSHRHMPEIEQGLSEVVGQPVLVSFTPHLIPMSRGMLCTTIVEMADGVTPGDLRKALSSAYEGERFVRVLGEGQVPHTRHVRGSNMCLISVFPDRIPGRAIILSVIDNLVKGASGQALQNMNLVMGFDEATGLMQQPMFP